MTPTHLLIHILIKVKLITFTAFINFDQKKKEKKSSEQI